MRYAAITVNLTVVPDTLGYSEGLQIRDRWEELISQKVSNNCSDAIFT